MKNLELGKLGERLATLYLLDRGYKLIQANYRSIRWGEIDLIMRDGEVFVFVEVKTRTSVKYGKPEEAVTYHKLRKLRRPINFFVSTNKIRAPLRVDVISILFEGEKHKIEHFKNVLTD